MSWSLSLQNIQDNLDIVPIYQHESLLAEFMVAHTSSLGLTPFLVDLHCQTTFTFLLYRLESFQVMLALFLLGVSLAMNFGCEAGQANTKLKFRSGADEDEQNGL